MLTFATFLTVVAPAILLAVGAAVGTGRLSPFRALMTLLWAGYLLATLHYTVFPIPPAGSGAMRYGPLDFFDTDVFPIGSYFQVMNVLMFVPFGFGIWWVHPVRRLRTVIVAGLAYSVAIESIQYAVGYRARFPYRAVDPLDVVLNTVGAALGALLLVAVAPALAVVRLEPAADLLEDLRARALVARRDAWPSRERKNPNP